MAKRRTTPHVQATRIQFPMQVVLMIVASAVSATAAVWATGGQLRSDVRDIKTRMELQSKIDEERQFNLKTTMDELNRRQQLQQMELQALKESLLSMKAIK